MSIKIILFLNGFLHFKNLILKSTTKHKAVMPLNILIALIFLMISCQTKSLENKSKNTEGKQADIKTCQIRKIAFNNVIECSGNMAVLPQNIASVSVPMGGMIKEIKYNIGDYVAKNAVLITLEHPDYIVLQQKYLEAKSSFGFYQQDYKRQAELAIENATSMKNMQKAKNEYEKSEAATFSLKSQLEMLGLDPDSVKSNNLISAIEIKSPINGIIVDINAHVGEYLSEHEVLFEIINKENLFLHLKIPENEIFNISKGQSASFITSGSDKKNYTTIKKIGKTVKNGMVEVYTDFLEKKPEFRPGTSVTASIQLSSDSIYVLPVSAVLNEEGQSFLFKKSNNKIEKIEITTGIEKDGFVEVVDPTLNLLDKEILLEATKYPFLNEK